MNNASVQAALDACGADLTNVLNLVAQFGYGAPVVQYLNKYALIRACGTIEMAYKNLIADYCSKRSKREVKQFLDARVRESSPNPTYSAIARLLKSFSSHWKTAFKAGVDAHARASQIKTAHDSLVGARNDFAHGGSPSTTVQDVIGYFDDCRIGIEILDGIIG